MIESINPLNSLLLLNSLVLIGFILNQNDSAKDSVTNQNASSLKNPFETFTWFSLIFEFSLFLLKIKITDV
jgi:hypothetical protein